MKKRTNMCPTNTFFASFLFSLSLFNAQKLLAQTPQEVFENHFKDWYQVELIIFERIEQAGQDPELWPKNISLSYPADLGFIIDENETKDDSSEDNNPDNSTATLAEDSDIPEKVNDNSELLETLKRTDITDPLNKKYLELVEQSELDRITPKEKPFILLEDEISQLKHEAHILGRDRAMRILLHKTWRQPMADKSQAPSIVITGGDRFDNHYELEGSIKLFVSRYLHLHTDLWLTEFEANVGQESEHWPMLPERPAPLEFETSLANDGNEGLESNNPSLTTNGTPQPVPFDTQLNTEPANFSLSFDSDNTASFGGMNNATLFNPYALSSQEESAYIVKHIVKMEQKRRMRSGELHYLDHPKLGLLVNIVKYEPEFVEPEAEVTTDENVNTP